MGRYQNFGLSHARQNACIRTCIMIHLSDFRDTCCSACLLQVSSGTFACNHSFPLNPTRTWCWWLWAGLCVEPRASHSSIEHPQPTKDPMQCNAASILAKQPSSSLRSSREENRIGRERKASEESERSQTSFAG